jgi:3-methyladenine DNA glycosylase AlkC
VASPLKATVGADVISDLAQRFAAVDPAFAVAAFTGGLAVELDDLELKGRIEAIARRLEGVLADEYPAALATVVAVADAEPPIDGFAAWALCSFVELFGTDDPALSLPAMEHLTRRASCEFAIRPFLEDNWDLTQAQLVDFAGSYDEAVRRLASEGTRPRLPWGRRVRRLVEEPEPGLALLERLRHDASPVVRRSVANHLNDITRDRPDLVVDVTRRWLTEDRPVERRMVAHGLRTLVKQGHPGALEVLGFTTEAHVEVSDFSVSPAVVGMGDHLGLRATLSSTGTTPQRLVVDLVIHHRTASGTGSPKVFKWATVDLEPGETVSLRKRRLIRQASTRTYHPGPHPVSLQVAGRVVAETVFVVEVATPA